MIWLHWPEEPLGCFHCSLWFQLYPGHLSPQVAPEQKWYFQLVVKYIYIFYIYTACLYWKKRDLGQLTVLGQYFLFWSLFTEMGKGSKNCTVCVYISLPNDWMHLQICFQLTVGSWPSHPILLTFLNCLLWLRVTNRFRQFIVCRDLDK